MNKKLSKIIIYGICIILLLTNLVSIVIGYDSHVFDCEKEVCNRCLFVHHVRESVKNIFIINSIATVHIISNLIKNFIIDLKCSIDISLVSKRVQLNE